MKLTAPVQLLTTPQQTASLMDTLRAANGACNWISQVAWESRTFKRVPLQRLVYYPVREKFGLSAQLTLRSIAKVADSYKLDRRRKRTFHPTGAIAYDSRILRWSLEAREVSIWTLAGRQRIPFQCGQRQFELLKGQQGESDLIFREGHFYLYATCEIGERSPQEVEGVLGVDLGVRNLAVDSDGEVYTAASDAHINTVRHRYRRLRRKLQHVGTPSAKRKLKKLAGKEQRFARDTNHCISKQLVIKAQRTKRALALEELLGLRTRVRVRRRQRAGLHSWTFGQLRNFVSYKAQRAGIALVLVNPAYTSQTCPACGHVSKSNRQSQSEFLCEVCGYAGQADHIAAVNISCRAAEQLDLDCSLLAGPTSVNQPIVARVDRRSEKAEAVLGAEPKASAAASSPQ